MIENKFKHLEASKKIEMLKKMYEIRHFEDEVDQLLIRGEIHGSCHLCVGQEASAVGSIYALDEKDYITSNHRGHGHCIAKGADIGKMMAEILGRKTGYCGGRGGSMHMADIEKGNLGTNGIVGGSIGLATGAALTCKLKENGKIVVCFFGDGAINRGIFHSSINMASIWNLPIIYLCENNLYGLSTPIKEAINISKISDRKCAYGIEGMTIDGNDLVKVFNTVKHFAEYCREGEGPVLIESQTYRWKGHSRSDAQVYRTKEEVKNWMEKDPIRKYKEMLIKEGSFSEKEDKVLEGEVTNEVNQAVKFARESPYPDPSTLEDDVYA
ncbi:MAG: thiamine pyrophosphate-dependent dehydrogenase E1 component subunit alpha [Actinobacteria bacterium]|nr:thiamine pyrophosphate-dependent dehydrogenase E1 component subunit alpha [Actinomycetota bacterium]